MNHELNPAIHMENLKLTVWLACKLGGTESQRISRVGPTVLARLMESLIRHPPAGSVVCRRKSSEKRLWPLPTFLSGRKLPPSSHLDARHFSSSLYVTGDFQAATLLLELKVSESDLVHVWVL